MSIEQTPERRAERSALWRIIYTNIVGLGFGENEARILVGFDNDLSKPGMHVTEEAIVVMPHRAAKMLAYTLNAVIANWEAVNGVIPIAQDKLDDIDRQVKTQAKPPDAS
jgi:hypothetical protein